ncbi:uncharacterized protein SCHCODRAFT_02698038 [Schizophyllum commune H4-8]|uniref:uncharacterized protein n=1 Tax=Schizophyllum commune (strain H4-8 / FGSC 9210) TaxID=578458 RepID=UPI00215F8295|nr:uncharacterized protein SCHCODRAFT_02698038 [Schizophyllum commune H4-8]KAI5896658.1 hypothetical protein SCHCODRAFT_02698038 [Schizophyllum commune H4-8]
MRGHLGAPEDSRFGSLSTAIFMAEPHCRSGVILDLTPTPTIRWLASAVKVISGLLNATAIGQPNGTFNL